MAHSVVPAVKELEKMFDHIWSGYVRPRYDAETSRDRKLYEGFGAYTPAPGLAPAPIINIAAPGKRRLGVWYVPAVWQNATNAAVAQLAGKKPRTIGELNVSTDLLTKSNDDIFKNLAFGAVMHLNQVLADSANPTLRRMWGASKYIPKTNYISSRASGYFRHYGVVIDEITLPSYNRKYVFEDITSDLDTHIQAYVIDNPKAFETHRNTQKVVTAVKGGQRKWMCPDCRIPIRSARDVHLMCACGKKVEYVDKDKENWMTEHLHLFTNKPGETTTVPSNFNSGVWQSAEHCALCNKTVSAYQSWDGSNRYSFPHINPAKTTDMENGPFLIERFHR